MKLKTFIALAILYIYCNPALAQGNKDQNIIINGTVNGNIGKWTKVFVNMGRSYNDSTTIKNGHYSIQIPFKQVEYIQITMEYAMRQPNGYTPFGLVADKAGIYTIHSDVSKIGDFQISGSETTDLYKKFEELRAERLKKMETDNPGHGNRMEWLNWYDKNADSLLNLYIVPLIENFIKEHNDSYVAPFILDQDGRNVFKMEQLEKNYGYLSTAMKTSSIGKTIHNYLQGLKNGRVGNYLTDISLLDSVQKNISLKSFKGKYVILDLWASWCSPCRASFPYLRKVYQDLKGPNFEILSITIDKDRNNWLKALHEEKNPWPQVIDHNDIVNSQLGVNGIPLMLLVDPDGKILLRKEGFDPNGENEIIKKLYELDLDKKQTGK